MLCAPELRGRRWINVRNENNVLSLYDTIAYSIKFLLQSYILHTHTLKRIEHHRGTNLLGAKHLNELSYASFTGVTITFWLVT